MNNEKKALQGKVAVITGAGKGIGRAVAKAFAEAGATLSVLSRSAGDLTSLRQEIGSEPFLWNAGDVADEAFVRFSVDNTRKTLSRIDVLVNNAGILTPKGALTEIESADWDETLRVNLRGPFLMMKHVLPAMAAQKEGVVLNLTSGAGKRAASGWGAYAVSKFGVEGLTRVGAEEMRPFGVRVNAVNPGGTRTRMRAAAYPQEDPRTLPTPEEVAEFFVWMASDAARDITGQSVDYRQWRETGSV